MGVLDALTSVVARAKATEGAELELRFGHLERGEFTVGCSSDQFHRIHERLHSNPLIQRTQWATTRSYAYPSNIRVILDGQGTANHGHVTKKPLQSMVIPGVHGIAFKVSLSTELACGAPLPTAQPTFVRLRERQQFFHGRGDRHAWAYDFTRTRGAPTEELAERADTVYEVELELMGGTTYMQETDAGDIARSILHRVTDLVRAAHARDQTERHIRPTNTNTEATQHRHTMPISNKTMPTAKLVGGATVGNTPPTASRGDAADLTDPTDMAVDIAVDTAVDIAVDTAVDMAVDMAVDPEKTKDPTNTDNHSIDNDDATKPADPTDHADNKPDAADPADPADPSTDTPARPAKRSPGRTKKAKPTSTLGAPKRPATSFMLFMSENRASINQSLVAAGTAVNLRETSKAGSLLWRNLTPESKASYVAQAAELHSEWVIRKVVYAASDLEHHDRPNRDAAIAKKKPRKTRNPAEPRRPGSPFVLFMNERRADIKESLSESGPSTVTDVGRRGGVLWRELTTEGRQVFTDHFNHLNRAYKMAMAEFTHAVGTGA